jgi:aspartate/methionine/tyrosine aminotransferase
VTAGGTHGLYLTMQALLSAGDEVLVFAPHWMAIPKLVGFAQGATYRTLPVYLALQAGEWDDAAFEHQLRAALTPATKGLYFNSPNNPTGVVLTRAQLQVIARVAIERDLWVISDEAYEHLLFDGATHTSIASLPGMAERTVSVFTFSKSYAMTGWRVGYVVCPPALRSIFGPLLAFYTTHGVFPSAQIAARAAVTSPQACVEDMCRAYDERRRLLLDGLAGCGAITVPAPKGSFYVFANVAGARAGRDVWTLIDEWLSIGVAALPGTAFGPGFDDWVRLALCTRREDVSEAARRLSAHHAAAARA